MTTMQPNNRQHVANAAPEQSMRFQIDTLGFTLFLSFCRRSLTVVGNAFCSAKARSIGVISQEKALWPNI